MGNYNTFNIGDIVETENSRCPLKVISVKRSKRDIIVEADCNRINDGVKFSIDFSEVIKRWRLVKEPKEKSHGQSGPLWPVHLGGHCR